MLLKSISVVLLIISFSGVSFGKSTHVRGYTKKDGTYVAPHERSAPDGNRNNNWSTRGNINPYTGQEGTKAPSYGTGTSTYSGSSDAEKEKKSDAE